MVSFIIPIQKSLPDQWNNTEPVFTHTCSTHPLYQVYAGLQVQPKVDEGPLDALHLVLLLLQDEHVVVEILLQLLVGKVDAQLLKAVELQEERRCVRAPGANATNPRGLLCTSKISNPAMSRTPMKY